MVSAVTSTSLRIFAGVVLAVTLLAGVYLSGKARRDAEQRVVDIRDGVASTELAEEPDDEEALLPLEYNPREFAAQLDRDIEQFGITPIAVTDLSQPNPHFVEVEQPITLAPGRRWTSAHLAIEVRLDRVNYMHRGAKISSVHVIARAENISAVPIAYRLRVRGDKGKCEVRGAREHNAITLRPGESAEIVVCAGRDKVRIEALEVLEITDLGHHYLSQVSPLALGMDATTAAAHKPLISVASCAGLDAKALSAYIEVGTASWADVVDFYARHNCHRLQFFPQYERPQAVLPSLPVLPPK